MVASSSRSASQLRFAGLLWSSAGCGATLATRNVTGYDQSVAIRSFRHRGLERFFTAGSKAGVQPKHAARLRLILGRLGAATEPRDMNLPGLHLHPLKGDQRGRWAVKVSGNWRVTFAFSAKNVEQVDYEDYH